MVQVRDVRELREGDIVRHVGSGPGSGYVVLGNYGTYALAVRHAHISNPDEWLVLRETVSEEPK